MPTDVQIQGTGTTLSFPDDMSQDQIAKVLSTHPLVRELKGQAIASAAGTSLGSATKSLAPYRTDAQARAIAQRSIDELSSETGPGSASAAGGGEGLGMARVAPKGWHAPLALPKNAQNPYQPVQIQVTPNQVDPTVGSELGAASSLANTYTSRKIVAGKPISKPQPYAPQDTSLADIIGASPMGAGLSEVMNDPRTNPAIAAALRVGQNVGGFASPTNLALGAALSPLSGAGMLGKVAGTALGAGFGAPMIYRGASNLKNRQGPPGVNIADILTGAGMIGLPAYEAAQGIGEARAYTRGAREAAAPHAAAAAEQAMRFYEGEVTPNKYALTVIPKPPEPSPTARSGVNRRALLPPGEGVGPTVNSVGKAQLYSDPATGEILPQPLPSQPLLPPSPSLPSDRYQYGLPVDPSPTARSGVNVRGLLPPGPGDGSGVYNPGPARLFDNPPEGQIPYGGPLTPVNPERKLLPPPPNYTEYGEPLGPPYQRNVRTDFRTPEQIQASKNAAGRELVDRFTKARGYNPVEGQNPEYVNRLASEYNAVQNMGVDKFRRTYGGTMGLNDASEGRAGGPGGKGITWETARDAYEERLANKLDNLTRNALSGITPDQLAKKYNLTRAEANSVIQDFQYYSPDKDATDFLHSKEPTGAIPTVDAITGVKQAEAPATPIIRQLEAGEGMPTTVRKVKQSTAEVTPPEAKSQKSFLDLISKHQEEVSPEPPPIDTVEAPHIDAARKLSNLTKPNYLSAERAIDELEMKHNYEDVGDARDALDEYKQVVRSDYESGSDGAEEYKDARSEAWQAMVDAVDNLDAPEHVKVRPTGPSVKAPGVPVEAPVGSVEGVSTPKPKTAQGKPPTAKVESLAPIPGTDWTTAKGVNKYRILSVDKETGDVTFRQLGKKEQFVVSSEGFKGMKPAESKPSKTFQFGDKKSQQGYIDIGVKRRYDQLSPKYSGKKLVDKILEVGSTDPAKDRPAVEQYVKLRGGLTGISNVTPPVTTNTPADRLVKELQSVKSKLPDVRSAYAHGRAERGANLAKSLSNVNNAADFDAAMRKSLSGQLNQPEIASLSGKFSQGDKDWFVQQINNHAPWKQFPYEKVTAKTALDKLFDKDNPRIPGPDEIDHLEEVFGKKFGDALRDMGGFDKIKREVAGLLNVPRALKSSVDFSAVLRQAAIQTVSHPVIAAKAFRTATRSMFSEEQFQNSMQEIRERPNAPLYDQTGLAVTSLKSKNPRLSDREEAFMSGLAEKVPWVRASERHYVTYLNRIRADVFDSSVKMLESKGLTMKNSPDTYKGLAKWINWSTGRGSLGKNFDMAVPLLNSVFFAPRFNASRLGVLRVAATGGYGTLPKHVRMSAMKDLAKFVGFNMTLISLAKLGGAKIETDPRSTDFGKITQGNTRVDLWAGMQPWARLIAQFGYNQKKSVSTGETVDLGSKYGIPNAYDVVASEARKKLGPIPSMVFDYKVGKDVVGNPVTGKSLAMGAVTPLAVQDFLDAWQNENPKSAIMGAAPIALGISYQTYNKK